MLKTEKNTQLRPSTQLGTLIRLWSLLTGRCFSRVSSVHQWGPVKLTSIYRDYFVVYCLSGTGGCGNEHYTREIMYDLNRQSIKHLLPNTRLIY